MRVAELLSDLTSLRACDPQASLALVSARPDPAAPKESSQTDALTASSSQDFEDADLKRARVLIELHSTVKVKHAGGVDAELVRAREDVRRAMSRING